MSALPVASFHGFALAQDVVGIPGGGATPDPLAWAVVAAAFAALALWGFGWRARARRAAAASPSADRFGPAAGADGTGPYDLSLVGLLRTSVDGERIIAANRRAAELYGYDTPEELVANVRPLDLHGTIEQRDRMVAALRETGRFETQDAVFRLRDGTLLPMALSCVLNEDAGYVESVVVDMRPVRRAQDELEEQRNFLQGLLDAMPNPFFYKSSDGRYRLVNLAFEDMLGLHAEDVVGRRVEDISPHELADTYRKMDEALFASRGRANQRYEHKVRGGNGMLDVMFSKESLFGPGGENIGLVGVMTDITRLRAVEKELRTTHERFRALFMDAAEGIFLSTPEGRFLEANPAMARLLGYASPEELVAEVTDIGRQVYVRPRDREEWVARLRREQMLQGLDQELVRKDCSRGWVSLSLRGEFDEDGELVRILGLASDITERKRFEEQLRHLATTDRLTELPNRMQFETALERMMAQAKRSGERLAVLYLDLDGFKSINDTYGHEVGDSLLVQVADRMRSRLRESDIGARIGGDEFGVLLWNVGGRASAEAVGRELATELSRSYVCNGLPCEVGASIGAALFPGDGESLRELLDRADKAMYGVKARGKSGFALARD